MKPVVLCAGQMGSVVVKFLLENEDVEQILVADGDDVRLDALAKKYGDKVQTVKINLSDKDELISTMQKGTLVISTAPLAFNMHTIEAAVEAGRSMIDLTGGDIKGRLEFNEAAKKKNIAIIPGCGVAPGLSNILAGYGASLLDKVDDMIIRVGGFPEHPKPPLGYSISWSLEALIDEYISEAHVIRDGRIITVPPLSGQETIYFERLGDLEGVITEGLSTLPYSFEGQGIKNIEERTLRYPGHFDKIRTLYECGLFETEPITVNGQRIAPLDVNKAVLGKKLNIPDDPDVIALRVNVNGVKNKMRHEVVCEMLDYYDKKEKISAMARTTTLTLVIIAELVANGVLKEKGVLATELCIGQNPDAFKLLRSGLSKHGIEISVSILPIK